MTGETVVGPLTLLFEPVVPLQSNTTMADYGKAGEDTDVRPPENAAEQDAVDGGCVR